MYSLLSWLPVFVCLFTTCAVLFLIGVVFRLYDHLAASRTELKNLQEALIERGMGVRNKTLGGKSIFVIVKPNRWKEKED